VTTASLSNQLLAFLGTYVPTLDELGVLSALIEEEGRWWNAATMARVVGIPPSRARHILDTYAASNLLDIGISDDVRYRLRPGNAMLEQSLREFSIAYRSTPQLVRNWVSSGVRHRE